MKSNDGKRLKALLEQWQAGTLPPQHLEEFLALLERPDLNQILTEETEKTWGETEVKTVFNSGQKEAMLSAIVGYQQPKRSWIRYPAAAAVLAAILTISFLWQPSGKKEMVAVKQTESSKQIADVAAPATNKAILTLGDGRKVILEDIREGTVTKEGNTNVTKIASDQLVYSGSATTGTWNTLTVPKGSKPFRVTLSDGSHVTVNVASSVTFPTAFSGNSRNVTMTGEAYFEIAKRPSLAGSGNLPFIVAMNGASVEVKGTKFNVNAYEDEGVVKTTLVEGAVNILAGNRRRSIAPGEQAIVMPDLSKEIKLEKEADIDEATAWINDKFRFHEADLQTVMRQVARWYDVEIKYAAKPKLRFGGQIDRSSTLREMFAILETSGVHFSLSGNVVTILP